MLKLIYKIIDIAKNFLIKFCKLIVNKLDKKDNDSSFNSLMPKEDIDISNYREALDYIFIIPFISTTFNTSSTIIYHKAI